MREVGIIGVGLHKFGRFPDRPYTELGEVAIREALRDAGVQWKMIQSVYAGSCLQGMAAGHNVCAAIGQTGIPIVNVEQACGSGSGALQLARQAIIAGFYDVVCVVGFEKLGRGAPPANNYPEWARRTGLAIFAAEHAQEAQRYMFEYSATIRQIATVSVVSHKHGALNPHAHYQQAYTVEEVLNSRMVADPMRSYMIAPADDGGAAIILCAKDKCSKYSSRRPIIVAGCAHVTSIYDRTKTRWAPGICYEELKVLANQVYERSGCGVEDLDVVQCLDSFCIPEFQFVEAFGFCERGGAGAFIESGATELGGKVPFNTDGGYIARGNAFGASGLASIVETVMQLRGEAGQRQAPDARVGLCESLGAGANVFATILKR